MADFAYLVSDTEGNADEIGIIQASSKESVSSVKDAVGEHISEGVVTGLTATPNTPRISTSVILEKNGYVFFAVATSRIRRENYSNKVFHNLLLFSKPVL